MEPKGQVHKVADDLRFLLDRPNIFGIDEESCSAAKMGQMDPIIRCYTKACQLGWIRITTDPNELKAAEQKYGEVCAIFWFWKEYPYRQLDKDIPYDSVYPLIAEWVRSKGIPAAQWIGLKSLSTMAGWSQAVNSIMMQDRRRDKQETCPTCGKCVSWETLLGTMTCPHCGWALA
jgi:hypothetical protein